MEGNEFGKDKVKEDGFLAVCEYFVEHENYILTVSDLVIKMSEYCEEPYSANWMKTKLLQHYDRQTLSVNRYGRKDVIMFYATAFDILQDYYTREKSDDEDEEKLRLQRAAADILKNDIKDKNSDTSLYFKPSEIGNIKEMNDILRDSLSVFLRQLFCHKV